MKLSASLIFAAVTATVVAAPVNYPNRSPEDQFYLEAIDGALRQHHQQLPTSHQGHNVPRNAPSHSPEQTHHQQHRQTTPKTEDKTWRNLNKRIAQAWQKAIDSNGAAIEIARAASQLGNYYDHWQGMIIHHEKALKDAKEKHASHTLAGEGKEVDKKLLVKSDSPPKSSKRVADETIARAEAYIDSINFSKTKQV